MEKQKAPKKSQSQEKRQAFQELNLSDDFIFANVMSDPEICRITLERILNIPIKEIGIPNTEHTIELRFDSKGVRLDIYVQDEEGDVYNCEMQTGNNNKELPKRSRYYHGCIDLDTLLKGDKYKDFRKAFVIFICTFDPFNMGRHIYTFSMTCSENQDLILDDGIITIFLNTKGIMNDVNAEMKEFLNYVENSTDAFVAKTKSSWVQMVHQGMKAVKKRKELEMDYIKLHLRDLDKIEEGREEGREEGLELAEQIFKHHKAGLTADEIAIKVNLTIEKINKIIGV